MKFKRLYLLLFYLAVFGCIAEKKWNIAIYNNSNHSIYYYVSSPGMGHVYPDTALVSSKPAMQQIAPGQYGNWDISYSFETFFKELPQDTLSIYVFHSDTLSKYDWNTIRNDYKVLRRYDLSLQDLQQKNYTVTYP